MSDIWTIIASTSTALGVVAVAYQLFKQRRWHIQHSTLAMADRFIEDTVFSHWLVVRHQMIGKAKTFDELTEKDQESVTFLLSYFETIGVMHKILDLEIIHDTFSTIIYELHNYTRSFLPRYREKRGNPDVYKWFEELALTLRERTEKDRARLRPPAES